MKFGDVGVLRAGLRRALDRASQRAAKVVGPRRYRPADAVVAACIVIAAVDLGLRFYGPKAPDWVLVVQGSIEIVLFGIAGWALHKSGRI